MYGNLLVPMDGSPLAEIALPYVYQLLARFEPKVTFLHVCREGDQSRFMCEAYVNRLAETVEQQTKAKKGRVSAVTVSGHVADGILEQARKTGSDMILMAAHGHSGPNRILGSTVHKVLAAAKTPVLVVREELPKGSEGWPKDVIVPLDGSSLSETVLPHVIALAKTGVNVTLLRVCEPPVVLADYPDSVMPDNWEEHVKLAQKGAEKTCNIYLHDIAKDKLAREGVEANSRVVLADGAANGIIEDVGRFPSALIVMSTHGRSGFSRWPYGHVADRILLASENPILLVRPQKP